MSLLPDSELQHETLGPMRFHDGTLFEGDLTVPEAPHWVARPFGWESADYELLVPGSATGPEPAGLGAAEKAHRARSTITELARRLAHDRIHLAWIDCRSTPLTAAFIDDLDDYALWQGDLSPSESVTNLRRGTW